MTNLRTHLEELAGIVANSEAGVIRANAKGELATLVVNNLPTILAALDAVEWRSMDSAPRDGTTILFRHKDGHTGIGMLQDVLFDGLSLKTDRAAWAGLREYEDRPGVWFETNGPFNATHWRPLGPLPEGE